MTQNTVHPNEVLLVFRGQTGISLPSKAYVAFQEQFLDSPKHLHALKDQAQRQAKALEAGWDPTTHGKALMPGEDVG